jgi:glycosyltransferase involved in cell wall biosynthesis
MAQPTNRTATMIAEAPDLSVVAPLHNEAGNVHPLFTGICRALEPLQRSFEVLLVNDGSTDETPEWLDELAAGDGRLRPVHLAANYGEAAALCAGFALARAPIILTLDGDLQNDPADLPRLLACLEGGPYRAVSGWRRQRHEAFIRRVLPSRIANWLIARVTGVPAKDTGCGLKAYRSEVVKSVWLPAGFQRFMPAIFGVRASEFAQIEVSDRPRRFGRSHYGLSRLFAVIRDLLAIPYVLRNAQRSVLWMDWVAASAMLCLAAGVAAWVIVGPGLGAALGLPALLGLGYASGVRATLQQWLRTQREHPFRLRATAPSTTALMRPVVAGAAESG